MSKDQFLKPSAAALALAVQATSGDFLAPVASTDVFPVSEMTCKPTLLTDQVSEMTGSIYKAGDEVTGEYYTGSFEILLYGSGTAGTSVDAISKALKMAGFAETLKATATPVAPEACGAGGTTTMAVLGTSASSTDDDYTGLPLQLSGTETGLAFVRDYQGSNKNADLFTEFGAAIDAGTSYQVLPSVRYSPAQGVQACSLSAWKGDIRVDLKDVIGNAELVMESKKVPRLRISFTGRKVARVDDATPTSSLTGRVLPRWTDGKSVIDKSEFRISQITYGNGISQEMDDDVSDANGVSAPVVDEGQPTLSIDPNATRIATRDVVSEIVAGQTYGVMCYTGGAAGRRVAFTMPNYRPSGADDGDRNKSMIWSLSGGVSDPESPFHAMITFF